MSMITCPWGCGWEGTAEEYLKHYDECPKRLEKEERAPAIEQVAATFTEPLLGQCRYQFFYLTNELYGGYSAKCEKGLISASYVNPVEVIDLAEKAKMTVHLAGDAWEEIGRKGYGEFVSPSEARTLLKQLTEKRAHHSSKTLGTVAERGTVIRHKTVGTIAKIVGSDKDGFIVDIIREADCKTPVRGKDYYALGLPYSEVDNWEIIDSSGANPGRVFINPAKLLQPK